MSIAKQERFLVQHYVGSYGEINDNENAVLKCLIKLCNSQNHCSGN